MSTTVVRFRCLLLCGVGVFLGPSAEALADESPKLSLKGDWEIHVTVPPLSPDQEKPSREISTTLRVPPPTIITVTAEKYDALPLYQAKGGGGWRRGVRLRGVIAQECTTRNLLDPESVELRAGPASDSELFELG